jgi:hypothetical protein
VSTLANSSGSFLGSARVSRAGEGVSPSRTFLVVCNLHILMSPRRSSFRRNAETSTLQECAPQKILRWPPIDLLAMPRLRNVLNPWLANVIHQDKGQSVCVWPTELIRARAFAIFGDFP